MAAGQVLAMWSHRQGGQCSRSGNLLSCALHEQRHCCHWRPAGTLAAGVLVTYAFWTHPKDNLCKASMCCCVATYAQVVMLDEMFAHQMALFCRQACQLQRLSGTSTLLVPGSYVRDVSYRYLLHCYYRWWLCCCGLLAGQERVPCWRRMRWTTA